MPDFRTPWQRLKHVFEEHRMPGVHEALPDAGRSFEETRKDESNGSWENTVASRVLSWYRNLSKAFPYTVAFVLFSGKALTMDLVAQTSVEEKESIDKQRAVAMWAFGGFYTGFFQQYLLNTVFDRVFGGSTALLVAVAKMLCDACIHTPFIYVPVFLAVDEYLRFGTLAGLWRRWCSDIGGIVKTYFLIWPPCMIFMFTLCPVELRMSVMALFSLVWLLSLSLVSH